MAQISRPFQIGLVAVALLAGVWLFALRGHSSSSSEPTAPATPAQAPSASAQAAAAAAPTPVYHGSAPGLTGLTGAIAKAHAAVAGSQQNAKQLEQRSAQASSASAQTTSTPTAGSAAAAAAPTHAAAPSTTKVIVSGSAGAVLAATLVRQRTVEAELKAGDVVAILFWDPRGSDDVAVRHELQLLAGIHSHPNAVAHSALALRLLGPLGPRLVRKIAVHEALASEVASFGSITRGIQVYGTPTILLIGRSGQVNVVSGLTDVYSLQQAVEEVPRS